MNTPTPDSKHAQDLVYTSADDCRVSLFHASDVPTITMARDLAASLGKKTHVKHLEARLRKLNRKEVTQ